MVNRKSYTGFPTSHQPRLYAAPNFLKMGIKYLNLSSFIQVSTIKDKKSAIVKLDSPIQPTVLDNNIIMGLPAGTRNSSGDGRRQLVTV